ILVKTPELKKLYHADHHIISKHDIGTSFCEGVLRLFGDEEYKLKAQIEFLDALNAYLDHELINEIYEKRNPQNVVDEFKRILDVLTWTAGNVIPGPSPSK